MNDLNCRLDGGVRPGHHHAAIQIIRRIAERGLRRAQERQDSEYVDLFQHILDELGRS
jgi:hypothetical protein